MAKKKIKTKEFDLPVYGSKIIFAYTNDYELLEKFCEEQEFHPDTVKELKTRDYYGYSVMLEDDDKKPYFYIFVIAKGNDKYEEVDTITHEVSHTVVNILYHKGIKFNRKNDEPYAYLTGYLNKEFFKFKDGK